MAGCMSNYLRDALIQHVFNHTSYTSPTTVYLAAFSTPPTAAGGGTEATSYTRVSISSHMAFAGSGTGEDNNTTQFGFTDLPNGTWVGVATFDASTSGNMLTFAQLTTPKTTTDGVMNFPIGDFVARFS